MGEVLHQHLLWKWHRSPHNSPVLHLLLSFLERPTAQLHTVSVPCLKMSWNGVVSCSLVPFRFSTTNLFEHRQGTGHSGNTSGLYVKVTVCQWSFWGWRRVDSVIFVYVEENEHPGFQSGGCSQVRNKGQKVDKRTWKTWGLQRKQTECSDKTCHLKDIEYQDIKGLGIQQEKAI